jgi:polyphosphate kinase
VTYRQLKAAQRKYVDDYFREKIFPILTPLAIDPAHPFPKLRSLNLNLWVELEGEEPNPERRVAVVPVPALLPRFISFEEDEGYTFILIEKVIAEHLDMLFQHLTISRVSTFRVTRNADLDISEAEADDLLKLIERELRKRRLGMVIRLEVQDDIPADALNYLREALGLEKPDVYRIAGPLGLESFFQLIGECDLKHLKDEPFTPVLDPQVASSKDIFEAIRKGDIILHHPYESFTPVIELLNEAARDPKVLAIKQTLYRTGGRSNIVAALKDAVERGKQVTALVELKARFDEETNISWARELERAGVNVVYGMMGLKTHSKLLLVIRQEEDGLRHYVHMSTGNYNERTAKVYTDVGLLTCDPDIGNDVLELFNVLTGYSRQTQWRKLFVAPLNMRQNFLERIDRCIAAQTPEQPSRIQLIMNSLVDLEMIDALYKASSAGVQIDLIIRGICCLVPGVPGQSENITVRSIVARFLEHTRIFAFNYGGVQEIYAGSADWMPRNLDRRIETVFPIQRPELQREAQEIIEMMLADNVKARLLQPDGTWIKVSSLPKMAGAKREAAVSVQEYFLAKARKRQKLVNTIPND